MDNKQLNPLIDIGANLTHESFANDLEETLQKASLAGVETIIVTGASETGSQEAQKLASRYPQLYATAGIHPHEANTFNSNTLALLNSLGQKAEVVAMGECGLDFYRDFSPRTTQKHCFNAQLEISCDIGKPVFLHERDAHDEFISILNKFIKDLNRVVVHCFTGNESQLDAYLEIGCYIGITGWICDERRGHHLQDFIGKVPSNRLMIETDSPYLLPRDLTPKPKSRRNEPQYLPHILSTLAKCTGKPISQVAKETTDTALAFFNIKPQS